MAFKKSTFSILQASTNGTLGAVVPDERDVHHLWVQEEIFISLPRHYETDTQHTMRQYFKDGVLSVTPFLTVIVSVMGRHSFSAVASLSQKGVAEGVCV